MPRRHKIAILDILSGNAANADGEQHAYRPYTPSASGASVPQRSAT